MPTNQMYFEPLISFAQWMFDRMTEQHMTVAELSRISGLSESSIAGYLRDEHEPSLFAVCCICHALGFSVGVTPMEIKNDSE